jgi:hypothetical protein
VVTEGAPINLSAAAPSDPDAIEKLMQEKGLGNLPIRPAAGAGSGG